jgi:hypothetical protein
MKLNRIRIYCLLLICGLVWMPAQAGSLGVADLPTDSNWYVHVNLDLIRNSNVGQQFMFETFNEAMDDIEDELNFDIRDEIEGVTVFGGELPAHKNPVSDGAVVLHGVFSEETQSALLSALERKGAEFSKAYEAGLAFYTIKNDHTSEHDTDEDGVSRDMPWREHEELYFSFGSTQVLITQSPEVMQGFLSGGGYLGSFDQVDSDALLVMQADRALLQGGANTSAEIAGKWDSSVLKNVDAVALVVAENQGGLQIDAQLVANSAEVAMSVRNIVEGLVALKALSDSEGVVGDVLRNVRFENDGSVLHVSVPVAADQVEALKDL